MEGCPNQWESGIRLRTFFGRFRVFSWPETFFVGFESSCALDATPGTASRRDLSAASRILLYFFQVNSGHLSTCNLLSLHSALQVPLMTPSFIKLTRHQPPR